MLRNQTNLSTIFSVVLFLSNLYTHYSISVGLEQFKTSVLIAKHEVVDTLKVALDQSIKTGLEIPLQKVELLKHNNGPLTPSPMVIHNHHSSGLSNETIIYIVVGIVVLGITYFYIWPQIIGVSKSISAFSFYNLFRSPDKPDKNNSDVDIDFTKINLTPKDDKTLFTYTPTDIPIKDIRAITHIDLDSIPDFDIPTSATPVDCGDWESYDKLISQAFVGLTTLD